MDRYLVISSDGHAGLHAADYRPYVDAKYRDAFDAALPVQIEATQRMSDYFLITEWWQAQRDARIDVTVLDACGRTTELTWTGQTGA